MPIIQQGGPVGRRGPSYGKTLYLYPKHGQLVVAAWPRRQSMPKTPRQLASQERWRQAQKMIPHIAPHEMVSAIEAVKGTYFLPRDLITAAMYGRTFEIAVVGLGTIYPNAWRLDIQAALDIFGSPIGALLTRNPGVWNIIRVGAAGSVLTSQGPGKNLIWKAH